MVSVVSLVLCFLHRDVMARPTPDMKTAKMMQVMIKKGIDIGVSSLLCATMEGAVGAKVAELGLKVEGASGGVKVVELVLKVEGGCVLLTCTYPLDQGLEFLLCQSLPPHECI